MTSVRLLSNSLAVAALTISFAPETSCLYYETDIYHVQE